MIDHKEYITNNTINSKGPFWREGEEESMRDSPRAVVDDVDHQQAEARHVGYVHIGVWAVPRTVWPNIYHLRIKEGC